VKGLLLMRCSQCGKCCETEMELSSKDIERFQIMIYLLYPMEFIHKQAEITRQKSLILGTASVIAFISFRMIFLG